MIVKQRMLPTMSNPLFQLKRIIPNKQPTQLIIPHFSQMDGHESIVAYSHNSFVNGGPILMRNFDERKRGNLG